MSRYGSDKPDLRFNLPLCDVTDVVSRHEGGNVEMLRKVVASRGADGRADR